MDWTKAKTILIVALLATNLFLILTYGLDRLEPEREKRDALLTILENNKRNYHTKPQKKNKFSDFLEKQMQASEEMKRKSDELKKEQQKRKK